MNITFQISAIPLANGKYNPKITLKEDFSASVDFTNFTINEVCDTKKDALERARAHAMNKARKQYGNDIEINIEELEN